MLGYDLVLPSVRPGPRVHCFATDVLLVTPGSIRAHTSSVLRGEEPGWDPHGPPPEPPSPSAELEREAEPVAEPVAFDALVSDLAPKTTGIRDVDQARSMGLVEAALALALELVKPAGVFVAKAFQGRGFDALLAEIRAAFTEVRALKPEATRQGSREAFLIARGRRRP